MQKVTITHREFQFIELFRIALSEGTNEERMRAIQHVKNDVLGARLAAFEGLAGPNWTNHPDNRELAEWAALSSTERTESVYEFGHVVRRYEERNERRLNVAEYAGQLIQLSVHSGKKEGFHKKISYQVSEIGRKEKISGARDKDTIRKSWGTYRGVVHLGMALDVCEDLRVHPSEVIAVSEQFRCLLSQTCPKGKSEPYVPEEEQIAFEFVSGVDVFPF